MYAHFLCSLKDVLRFTCASIIDSNWHMSDPILLAVDMKMSHLPSWRYDNQIFYEYANQTTLFTSLTTPVWSKQNNVHRIHIYLQIKKNIENIRNWIYLYRLKRGKGIIKQDRIMTSCTKSMGSINHSRNFYTETLFIINR